MSLIYNQTDLQALSLTFRCCAASKAYNALKCSINSPGTSPNVDEAIYLEQASNILEDYTPAGVLLSPGYVASAEMDLSAFSAFGDLLVNIIINGQLVGVVPDGNYPDIDSLCNAIVTAINTGGSSYTAGYMGSGLISIQATTAGVSANGFTVDITINPTFQGTSNLVVGVAGQPYINNDPTSPFYGIAFLGTSLPSGNDIAILNGLTVQSYLGVPNPGWPYNLDVFLLEGFESLDRIYVTGLNPGRYSYIKNDFTLYTSGAIPPYSATVNEPYINSSPPIVSNAYSTIEYNAINNTLYLGCKGAGGANNQVRMIDNLGAMSTLGSIIPFGPTAMKANSSNGDMWYLGEPDIFIYDSANNLVQTIAGVPGINPTSIEYCPTNNRMYVAFFDTVTPTNSYVRSYNATTYAVDVATFYSLGGRSFTMLYSEVFNMLFIQDNSGGSRYIDIVRLNGSLKQSILLTPTLSFIRRLVEDVKNQRILVVTTASIGETPTQLTLLELTDSGDEVFSATLENGIEPEYTTGEGNCLSEEELLNVIEVSNKLCC